MSVEPAAAQVPIAEHLLAIMNERDRLYAERAQRQDDALKWFGLLVASQRTGDQLAVQTALERSNELAAKHNDLIRAGEKKDATYATQEQFGRLERWQARMMGGLLVVSAVGLANFVRLWTGVG